MGKVLLHPDRRVCEAVQLVFGKFRERWTVRQTFQWFRDHDVELPANPIRLCRVSHRTIERLVDASNDWSMQVC